MSALFSAPRARRSARNERAVQRAGRRAGCTSCDVPRRALCALCALCVRDVPGRALCTPGDARAARRATCRGALCALSLRARRAGCTSCDVPGRAVGPFLSRSAQEKEKGRRAENQKRFGPATPNAPLFSSRSAQQKEKGRRAENKSLRRCVWAGVARVWAAGAGRHRH